MAEWSHLPKEIIELIAKRITSEIDFLRFRSVCSAWRSSVPAIPYNTYPSHLPAIPNDGVTPTNWGFEVSIRSIYLIASPKLHNQSPRSGTWIIKFDRESPNRVRLLNPLTRAQLFTPFDSDFPPLTRAKLLTPFDSDFPKVVDISRYRIHELGFDCTLQFIQYQPFDLESSSFCHQSNFYMRKVVFCWEKGKAGFGLLAINNSGKLVVYRSGDSKWTVINDSARSKACYDDVIAKGERFYAVDRCGRAVVLNLDCELKVVAHSSGFGGNQKYLVESGGDLLMIDKYLIFNSSIMETTLKLKVYKLDEDEEKWVELASLGNRIMFLGDKCAFSVSVSELNSESKGNCVVLFEQFYEEEDDEEVNMEGIGVVDLENGGFWPFSSYTCYSQSQSYYVLSPDYFLL